MKEIDDAARRAATSAAKAARMYTTPAALERMHAAAGAAADVASHAAKVGRLCADVATLGRIEEAAGLAGLAVKTYPIAAIRWSATAAHLAGGSASAAGNGYAANLLHTAALALAAGAEILRKLPAGNTLETRAALAAVVDAAQAAKASAEAAQAALEAEYEAGRLARCEARSLPRAWAARATAQAAQRSSAAAAGALRATARAIRGVKRAGLDPRPIARAALAAEAMAEEAAAYQAAIYNMVMAAGTEDPPRHPGPPAGQPQIPGPAAADPAGETR